ncbi:MAG: hypothetical protein IK096_07100 [Lachnospiraceae bacterium]|nr:hypothetical protein [Lachnospiraceae bacterium]
MKKKRLMILMTATCLALSGCGRAPDAVVEKSDLTQEVFEYMGNNETIPINEELMEPMMIHEDTDRNVIVERAREKVGDSRHILGFPENGGLPDPQTCVDGISVKEHRSYIYIFYMAEGDAAYDEVEMFSSALAYLSILQYSGFRIDTNDAMTRIYDGDREVAHFVIAGTLDSGYLMYLQIMD